MEPRVGAAFHIFLSIFPPVIPIIQKVNPRSGFYDKPRSGNGCTRARCLDIILHGGFVLLCV